jgi:nodulation protein E
MNRVVITGMGVVSSVGQSLDGFWSALVEGRSGIGPLTIVPPEEVRTRLAAEVRDFDPAAHFDEKQAGHLDRFSQFAVCAARQAMHDASLAISDELANETATVIGCGAGGLATMEDAYVRLFKRNSSRVHPFSIPNFIPNAAGCQVSIDLGLKGPAWTVTTACASGSHAIGQAFHLLRNGQASVAVTGGCEATLTLVAIKSWEGLRVLTADTCRPFSRNRSGMVLGEGAAMLVLETRDHAVKRGARIYAELLGFGMSADASDMVAPDAGGAARAMTAALKDARLAPDAIDYVNAHGTATVQNDQMECEAIRMSFGEHAARLAVSSTKAVLGHALGASGALELVATALALQSGTIPPTANFEEADPACGLDVVPNEARSAPIQRAMSNSFAFGGLNAVLVLGRA